MSEFQNVSPVFDCHLHVEKGLDDFDIPLEGANVIFNSFEDYTEYKGAYRDYYHTLIFSTQKESDFYNNLIANKEIVALKIHSRLQGLTRKDYPDLIAALQKVDEHIPIIYDAFYYGSELSVQPSLGGFISLVKAFPARKFIVAHAGGYEVLKYFFHLKQSQQVGFDLSLSLQYLEDSSCKADLVKMIKFMPDDRLFFGTDFPEASPSIQLKIILDIAQELQLSKEHLQGILRDNWKEFIGINKST